MANDKVNRAENKVYPCLHLTKLLLRIFICNVTSTKI